MHIPRSTIDETLYFNSTRSASIPSAEPSNQIAVLYRIYTSTTKLHRKHPALASFWRDTVLTCETLIHLASLPILGKLEMRLPVLQSSQELFPSLPFPALRDLQTHVESLADANEFLQLISNSSNLKSLVLKVSIIPPARQLYTFLKTVCQSNSRDTLTTVTIRDDRNFRFQDLDEEIPPSHSIEGHTLKPLLHCPNVERISIGLHYNLEAIDNSFMENMALAWPRLHYVSFFPYPRSHCSFDLEGLLHLARHCPALEAVSVPFNVTLPTSLMHSGERPGNGVRNESMINLWVFGSPIGDPPTVATFLSDVFPNMTLNYYIVRSSIIDGK